MLFDRRSCQLAWGIAFLYLCPPIGIVLLLAYFIDDLFYQDDEGNIYPDDEGSEDLIQLQKEEEEAVEEDASTRSNLKVPRRRSLFRHSFSF